MSGKNLFEEELLQPQSKRSWRGPLLSSFTFKVLRVGGTVWYSMEKNAIILHVKGA